MKNSKKIIVFILFGLISFQSVTASNWHHQWNHNDGPHRQGKIDFKRFFIDLLELGLQDFAALAAHELGHALTSYALVGDRNHVKGGTDLRISIGSPQDSDSTKLFEIPSQPSRFSLTSIFPIGGFTVANLDQNSMLKNIIIFLAGPLCGALTHYLFNMYTTYKLHKKYNIKLSFKELLKKSLYSPDAFSHLIENLFPRAYNDGAITLAELFPKTLNHTSDEFYKAATAILVDYIDMQHAIHTHKKLNNSTIGKMTGAYKKHLQEYIVRDGNRYIMILVHKLLAYFKHGRNTMFTPTDAARITFMLLYQDYLQAVRNVYSK